MTMYLVTFEAKHLEKYGTPVRYHSDDIGIYYYVMEVSPALFMLLKLQHSLVCKEHCLPNVIYIRQDGTIKSHMDAATFRALNVPVS